MLRHALLAIPLLVVGVLLFSIARPFGQPVEADVAGVSSNVPSFGPGQPVTITVNAEDDDGVLEIDSSLVGSTLTVTNCSNIGNNQVAGKCDGSGMSNVTGQGTLHVKIATGSLDTDSDPELLSVTLTLIASCTTTTIVTVSGDQPGNVGPDDVTINCVPATPTPTPTLTPTVTLTPTPTATGTPVATSTPAPTFTPVAQVLSTGIKPPSTGDAGLK